jgi:hypothetical protein
MLMHTTLLPLSLLLGMMVLTAQADDPVPVNTEKLLIPLSTDVPVPVNTVKLLIPLTTDDPVPIVVPTEVPRPKSPRDPIQRRLPGPSRM